MMSLSRGQRFFIASVLSVLSVACVIGGLFWSLWPRQSATHTSGEVLSTLFSPPNGATCQRPCLLGIEPPTTSIDQAMWLIKTHPYTRGNAVIKAQDNKGQNYLRVGLGENSLRLRVDYTTNTVLQVSLISKGVNGLGFMGIVIEGQPITWGDVVSYLGPPDKITASSGDGGMISLAVGLYEGGWCIHASPSQDFYPLQIPWGSRIIFVEVNCYFYRAWINGKL